MAVTSPGPLVCGSLRGAECASWAGASVDMWAGGRDPAGLLSAVPKWLMMAAACMAPGVCISRLTGSALTTHCRAAVRSLFCRQQTCQGPPSR